MAKIDLHVLKGGSEDMFAQLVKEYSPKVYSICWSILKNQADAEDAVQEVFVSVWLGLSSFQGDSLLSTWIYRITVNKCKELLRKKNRKKRFAIFSNNSIELNVIEQKDVHPGIHLENKERAQILFDAIQQLPDNQATAYTLNKMEGFSYEEVAQIMEISLSAVESVLFRAKANLKKSLLSKYAKNDI